MKTKEVTWESEISSKILTPESRKKTKKDEKLKTIIFFFFSKTQNKIVS